jgi:DNA-binding LacI/PurR family transcriptional regulator
MKELDYQPNMIARSLVTGKSSIVGLIVPDLLNPFSRSWRNPLEARFDNSRMA